MAATVARARTTRICLAEFSCTAPPTMAGRSKTWRRAVFAEDPRRGSNVLRLVEVPDLGSMISLQTVRKPVEGPEVQVSRRSIGDVELTGEPSDYRRAPGGKGEGGDAAAEAQHPAPGTAPLGHHCGDCERVTEHETTLTDVAR